MVVLPLSKLPNDYDADMGGPKAGSFPKCDSINWVRFASAATLIAGGALLLGGKRRAGLLAAATGTALRSLDQQDLMQQMVGAAPQLHRRHPAAAQPGRRRG